LAVGAVLLIQVAFVASFVVAPVNPRPHEIPIAVVGPPPAVGDVQESVERRHPHAFSLRRFASPQGARDALARRYVYGAFLLDAEPPQLLVASAASPAIANLLRGALGRLGTRPVAVRDVHPLDRGDPRGLLINLVLLPLVVTAVLAPLFLRFLAPTVRGARHLLAVSAPTTALIALRGVAGVGLGFLVFLIVGNVASGAAGAPELLPGFWRTVGEFLPPGAAATALRNAAYFPAASVIQPLAVLGTFVVVGAAVELMLGPRQAGRALFAGGPAACEEVQR